MAANPKYNWIFSPQNNRFYPRADRDIDISGLTTTWDSENKKYVTKDSFGNIIEGFEEFAREQREYFKRFCGIVGNTGKEKPWVLFDHSGGLQSGYTVTNEKYVSGNVFTGYASGCNGPFPSGLQNLKNWEQYKATNSFQVYTAEQFLKEYDGVASWPSISEYSMRLRCPPEIEDNFIARQTAPRGGEGLRDQRVSPPQIAKTFFIQEYGAFTEDDSYPVCYQLGTIEDWTEYQAGVDTILYIKNDAGFQLLREKSEEFPNGFDPDDGWFLSQSPYTVGWPVKSLKVADQTILIKTSSVNLNSSSQDTPLYLCKNVTISEGGNFKLPKFEDGSYTVNDGSEPYYIIVKTGVAGSEDGKDYLVGYFAVAINTPNGKILCRVFINSLSPYLLRSIYPHLPLNVFTSTNTSLPAKFELVEYKSLHAALSDIDVNATQFVDATYSGNKWNIQPMMNWYDDMWLDILKEDLGFDTNQDIASNVIVCDGKLNYHDRVRVLVDGEFNENNKMFERTMRDRNTKAIHAIKARGPLDLIIDKDFNCYYFPYTSNVLNIAGGNIETQKGTYSGYDRLCFNRFIKENYSAATPTPEPPDNKLTAWKDIGILSDGQTFTPADGNVATWDMWEGSEEFKIWDDELDYNGNPYYIPAYEPAYVGDYVVQARRGDSFNGTLFVNKNDNLDMKISPGLIAGTGYWQATLSPNRTVDWQDQSTSSSISAKFYIPDLDDDWIGSSNKKPITKVVVDFICSFTDTSGSPAIRHNVIGNEIVDYTPGEVNTWTPPQTYSGDADLLGFAPRPYVQQGMQSPQGFTGTIQETDPSQPAWAVPTQITSHYVNESRSSSPLFVGGSLAGAILWNIDTTGMIGSSYGKITDHNAQGMGRADFLYQTKWKPYLRIIKTSGKFDDQYTSNVAYIMDDDVYTSKNRMVAWATVYGETLSFASACCALQKDPQSDYEDDISTTYKNDGVVTYTVETDSKPFIDVLRINTDRKHQINAIIYNLPYTQFYIENSDDLWDSIETRCQVWGFGDTLNYSTYDVPQFRQHVFGLSGSELTISQTTGSLSDRTDYSWTFKLLRPTIDDSDYAQQRSITVDPKSPQQHIRVFASTTDHDYFTEEFENQIEGIKQTDGTYKLDITYGAGTKYRIYVWDTVMSMNLRSKEYTSLGALPVSGNAGNSTPPSPLNPSGGGIVDV